MNDFQERRIRVGDSSFQVHIEGKGPALLLLHGFTGSIQTMAGLSALLSHHFCVISVDLPGHGRTTVPDDPDCYTFSSCNNALVSLLDQLHIEKCFVCGYSMGGRVALLFAADFPTRVAAVATIGASGGIEAEKERALRKNADEKLALFIKSEGIGAFVRRWMDHPLFASQKKLGKTFLDEACRQRLGNNPYLLAYSLRGMGTGAQLPVYHRLKQIDIPMLFIAGAEDNKFCDLARRLKSSCPQGHTQFVEEAGHAAHLENGPMTADSIAIFFGQYQAVAERQVSISPFGVFYE